MASRPWTLAIDFGTSFTVAVAQVEGRPPEVVEIAGERRIPSVVLTEADDRIVVGRVADELSATNPEHTLRRPKSRLGDQAPVVLAGKPYQVVQLVAALLSYIAAEASRQYGGPPTEVRLTHPATWNRPWLNRLQEAAVKAGLPHPVLVPEPVAAAFSYAAEVGAREGDHIAVYDLGGGTFDTAVVNATASGFVVVGRPGGDPSIGGELFDEILVNEIGGRLDPPVWEALQVAADATWQRVAASLRSEVRRAKETLSSHPYADILLPLPSGLAQQRITRDEYDELVGPYIEETVVLLGRCIANAGLTPDQLSAIYLVGGASRAPIVERLTTQAFPGVPVSRRGDPKTSVAMGAVRATVSADTGAITGPTSTEDAAAATADTDLALGTPPGAAPGPAVPPPPRVVATPTIPPPGAPPSPPPTPAPTPAPMPSPAPAPIPAPPASPPSTPAAPPAEPRGPAPAPTVAPQPFTQAAPTSAPPSAPPAAGRPRTSGRRNVVIGIVAAVVALALVVGGMLALAGGGDDGGSTRTVPPSTDETRTTRKPTTTVEDTVPEVPAEELEAKLLSLAEVNEAVGGGFVEVDPGPPGDPICGLESYDTQTSVIRVFDNADTGARVATAIDRYPTESLAEAAFEAEVSLGTTCADRTYEIDGVEYSVLVLPFAESIQSRCPDCLGLLVGYTPTDTSAGQEIYQFVVEARDGANVIGSSYITVGRPLTDDEISGYIELYLLARNRAVS